MMLIQSYNPQPNLNANDTRYIKVQEKLRFLYSAAYAMIGPPLVLSTRCHQLLVESHVRLFFRHSWMDELQQIAAEWHQDGNTLVYIAPLKTSAADKSAYHR